MKTYFGYIIHRKTVFSSALRWSVIGVGSADTLAGIKRLIREHMNKQPK